MNYKQAKKIQGIVFDLDCMNEISTFQCAVEPVVETGEWEVYIYPRKPYTAWEKKVNVLGIAIYQVCEKLHITLETYNAGTTDVNLVEAVRMW